MHIEFPFYLYEFYVRVSNISLRDFFLSEPENSPVTQSEPRTRKLSAVRLYERMAPRPVVFYHERFYRNRPVESQRADVTSNHSVIEQSLQQPVQDNSLMNQAATGASRLFGNITGVSSRARTMADSVINGTWSFFYRFKRHLQLLQYLQGYPQMSAADIEESICKLVSFFCFNMILFTVNIIWFARNV